MDAKSKKSIKLVKAICFKQDGIIKLLNKNPDLIDDKKFHELLVGWLLAQFMNETERESIDIWFPPKIGWERFLENDKPSLEWLLRNHDRIFDDTDVDICIGNEGKVAKFQITRFFNPWQKRQKDRLVDLIQKKCRRCSPDKKLYLVVNIESKPNITETEIQNLIINSNVPFEKIFLIAKASDDRGHFRLLQIYPGPIVGKDIRVPLPV